MKLNIILIILLLTSIASANTLVSSQIIDSQYGTFLAERGIGNALYQFTYSDGTQLLKYVEGIHLLPASITPSVARTIKVYTYESSTSWICSSIIVTGSDGSTSSSSGCGSTTKGYSYANYTMFQIAYVEMAKNQYGYVEGRDTVYLNNALYQEPQLAKVTAITTTKVSETQTQETVRMRLTFNSGVATGEVPVILDSLQIMLIPRVSGSSVDINVALYKDGKSHSLCVETTCTNYVVGRDLTVTPTPSPSPTPSPTLNPYPDFGGSSMSGFNTEKTEYIGYFACTPTGSNIGTCSPYQKSPPVGWITISSELLPLCGNAYGFSGCPVVHKITWKLITVTPTPTTTPIATPTPVVTHTPTTTPTPTTTSVVIITTPTCNTGTFYDQSTDKCIPDLKLNPLMFFFAGLIIIGIIYIIKRKYT
ncbi:MAG: hypothetical protein OIN86_13040 [Candidatus Methanoperedens sp.]|nr:hypothetical protein [Candidatus Methanoperedens sp.]CAG0948872.1 hypothetical protein METP1_00063 [Methanosarcinales archaeon]